MKRFNVVSICVVITILLALPSMISPAATYHVTEDVRVAKSELKSPIIYNTYSDIETANQVESQSVESRVENYLSTDWKKNIPTEREISQINDSIVESSKPSLESALFEPAITLPDSRNASTKMELVVEDIQKSSVLSQDYFSGHVWASSFGPNDVDTEAVPIVPTLEGHYFPKESYSRIYYHVFLQPGMKLHLRVERDQDTYGRYFRVYFGSTEVFETIIWPGTDSWEGDINIGSFGDFIITIEIYYGGYKEKGWQLRYFHLFDSDGQPYDADAEMFPKKSSSELVYRVPMGPNTKLNIETANLYDPYTRYLYIYVDNRYMTYVYAPGSYEINFADYGYQFSTPGMHEIKFVLYWGGYVDYGKRLKHYWINYEYRRIEIDWMEGWFMGNYYNYTPTQEEFDYVETYYIIHDYRRVEFFMDGAVTFDEILSDSEYINNYLTGGPFKHYLQTRWSYGLYAHRVLDQHGVEVWGAGTAGSGFRIGCYYTDPGEEEYILTHEYGHVEYMHDDNGGISDVYGTNPSITNPFYCSYSWVSEHLNAVRSWW